MLRLIAAVALTTHGLLHSMGMASLWRLSSVPAYPYTTTVLDGAFEIGEPGALVLGAAWAFGGLLFVAAGLAIALADRRALPLLALAAFASGALSLLGMPATAPGATVNAVLLALTALIWLFSRRTAPSTHGVPAVISEGAAVSAGETGPDDAADRDQRTSIGDTTRRTMTVVERPGSPGGG